MIREILDYKQFLREFTAKEFRSRYRSSVLGLGWTVLLPLATVFALGFVLFFISRADPSSWGTAFLGGYLAWSYFAVTVGTSVGSIVGNSVYVSRIYAPKAVFPLSAFVMGTVEFVAFFIAVLIVLLSFGATLHSTLVLLPLAALVFAPFILGVSFLFAAANVFWRDTAFLWTALSSLWFFLTPILYPISTVPPSLRPVLEANPVYPYVRIFQALFTGSVPPAELWVTAILLGALTMTVGVAVFRRNEERFYLYL